MMKGILLQGCILLVIPTDSSKKLTLVLIKATKMNFHDKVHCA
jgi:hypothetical protein